MGRNYLRKTERQSWDQEAMKMAIAAVTGGMKLKTASRTFKVPVMTLKRRVRGQNTLAVDNKKLLGSKRTVFTEEQETELANLLVDMERKMYCLTPRDMRVLAFQLAEKNGIKHPFSKVEGAAGQEWLRGFRERHPEIILKNPESSSKTKNKALSKSAVRKFLELLKGANRISSCVPSKIETTGSSDTGSEVQNEGIDLSRAK